MRQAQKKTVAALKSRYGLLPLEFMLEVMNNEKLTLDFRCAMAGAAAPYLHPKLKAMEIDAPAGPGQPGLDLTKLTDEELDQLEQIMTRQMEP